MEKILTAGVIKVGVWVGVWVEGKVNKPSTSNLHKLLLPCCKLDRKQTGIEASNKIMPLKC